MSLLVPNAFLRAATLGAFALATSLSSAQAPGHLTVSSEAVRTLVPSGAQITASMCQAADAYCLSNGVGQPLFSSISATTTDSLGNIYAADSNTGLIVKVSPSGLPLVVAGRYRNGGTGAGTPAAGLAINLATSKVSGLALDSTGNLYLADATAKVVAAIDALGDVTLITAATGGSAPKDGAFAKATLVAPGAVAADSAGDLFFSDANTCTVLEEVKATAKLKIIAGVTASGCVSTTATPTTGQPANTQGLSNIDGIALGLDGTVYFSDYNFGIYSVTADGTLHQVAPASGSYSAGPLASGGSIGNPQGLSIDAAGDLYATSWPGRTLFELTAGISASPATVITIAGGYSTGAAGADGSPSTLTYAPTAPALDPFGRIIGGVNDTLTAYDRNGALVFNGVSSYSQQTLTYSNSGGTDLHGVNFGGTGFPFLIGPTNDQITQAGESGNQPFSVFEQSGTCLAKFGTGSFTLAPGESCTITVEYAPNDNVPPAGILTFFTDDPLGPLSVSLSATSVTPGAGAPQFAISAVRVKPSASANAQGNFNFNVQVLAGSGTGTPITPTGTVVLGILNVANGATVFQQPGTLDQTGNAQFSATGLANGTYIVDAVYEGDGSSAPVYPAFQVLQVAGPVDVTLFALAPGHVSYGPTGQFLNFSGTYYSNPGTVFAQDLLVGNTSVSFQLNDSYGYSVIGKTTPLFGDTYTVVPVVANAAALDYGVTLHPLKFALGQADLTIYEGSRTVSYGLLEAATSDSTHFTLPVGYISAGAAAVQSDETAGLLALTTALLGAPVDPTTTPLPVGFYSIGTTLSGTDSSNYSLTDHRGTLQVAPADLTIYDDYTNIRYGQLLTSSTSPTPSQFTLTGLAYIATGASAVAADEAANRLIIVPGFTNAPVDPSTTPLPVGTWTIASTLTGSAASNYSLTDHPGNVHVSPADLTLRFGNVTLPAAQLSSTHLNVLCGQCYTLPNSQSLGTDATLAQSLTFKFTPVSSGTGATVLYNKGAGTFPSLTPGKYTVTPCLLNASSQLVCGGTVGNFGLSAGSSTLTVQ